MQACSDPHCGFKNKINLGDRECRSFQRLNWKEQILHLILAKRPRRYGLLSDTLCNYYSVPFYGYHMGCCCGRAKVHLSSLSYASSCWLNFDVIDRPFYTARLTSNTCFVEHICVIDRTRATKENTHPHIKHTMRIYGDLMHAHHDVVFQIIVACSKRMQKATFQL